MCLVQINCSLLKQHVSDHYTQKLKSESWDLNQGCWVWSAKASSMLCGHSPGKLFNWENEQRLLIRFGVCCLFLVTASGSVITQNCTYIRNPGFPSAYSATSAVTYTINKCISGIQKRSSCMIFSTIWLAFVPFLPYLMDYVRDRCIRTKWWDFTSHFKIKSFTRYLSAYTG